MSTIYDVVLTTPHADYSPDKAVNQGLDELGFRPASDDGRMWLLLDQKLHFHAEGKFGVDGLRELVLALPWHDWGVPTLLQVLWMNEHTTEDDGWAGRTAPYSWHHETWEVPDEAAAVLVPARQGDGDRRGDHGGDGPLVGAVPDPPQARRVPPLRAGAPRMSRIEGLADLRMRASLYLGRTVRSSENFVDSMNEVLDQATADRAALDEMREQG